MSFELTDEQLHELDSAGDKPVYALSSASKREYVVLPIDLFTRLCASSDTLTMAEVGELVNQNMREYDEDDPILESYQKYRP